MGKEYIYPYFQNLSSGGEGGGGADVSGVTATAGDVDTGKVFVDSSGQEVTGTSTYKNDYITLNTLVGQTTAVAGDVDNGKYFVGADGLQKTGSNTAKADLASLTQIVNTANNNLEEVLSGGE